MFATPTQILEYVDKQNFSTVKKGYVTIDGFAIFSYHILGMAWLCSPDRFWLEGTHEFDTRIGWW